MRTTISIEDSLLQKAKKISHERRCSLRTVIEDALRAAFAKERKRTRSGAPRPLKTFKGRARVTGKFSSISVGEATREAILCRTPSTLLWRSSLVANG